MLFKPLLSTLLWVGSALASAPWVRDLPKLLVVLEDSDLAANYSQFLDDLQTKFIVDIQSPKSEKLALFTHDERSYDNLVLFPPKSKGYGPNLTPQLLARFLAKDGNILLLTSPEHTPEQARELARELDIDLPPRDFLAVDHFNYDTVSAPEKHDVILIPPPADSAKTRNYFSSERSGLIAFRGAGHMLGNRPLLFPILSASRTAYTYDTKDDEVFAEDAFTAGQQMHYITALQTRSNARFAVSGSTDLFSDEFFDLTVTPPGATPVPTANREFALQLIDWLFGNTGVVRVHAVRHFLTGEEPPVINPSMYRVKNDVTFEIELRELMFHGWEPFELPADDALQLEFTMLDPYYRLNLTATRTTEQSTVFSTSFKIPDQHGVFAFKVNYKRPFVSYIDEKHTVTVRHYAHNEYTRSWDISGAWVWIAGIAVTVTAWIVFCGLWLYSAPTEKTVKKTQ